jgi:uroporphyrinogen III methyltransferase/synthase
MPGAPLSGRRVLVTRPSHQAESLARLLAEVGADVDCLPTIRLRDPEDRLPLLQAAGRLDTYDWAVFTSVNGVERFLEALAPSGILPGGIDRLLWAAIGPATARALHAAGIRTVLLPRSYRAEALADAMHEAIGEEPGGDTATGKPMAGLKILLARAGGARPVLPRRLRALGAEVDEVVAYVTEPNDEVAAELKGTGEDSGWDWITFTASSAVRAFGELGGTVGDSRVAVIGPITAGTARSLGIPVHAMASEYTVPGLVRAIAAAEQ